MTGSAKRDLIGVCISPDPVSWDIGLPLSVSVGEKRLFKGSPVSHERIRFFAAERNRAVELALSKYPDATDVLMVDAEFLGQADTLKILISDYFSVKEDIVLGAAIWSGKTRTRISHIFRPPKTMYGEYSSTPELRWVPFSWSPEKDGVVRGYRVPLPWFFRVQSPGECYVFPRCIWDNGARFDVPENLDSTEHRVFVRNSGLPAFIDMRAKLFKDSRNYLPIVKCIRGSIDSYIRFARRKLAEWA